MLWLGPHPDHPPAELPEEWVLRQLADVKMDDDNAVAAMLHDYGVISWPYFDRANVPNDRHRFLAPRDTVANPNWWEQRADGTLEDARWWLKTARALAGTWRNADQGQPLGLAWAAEGFLEPDDESAWWQFTHALNTGLQPFRAHIELRLAMEGDELKWGMPRVGLYSAACRQIFNFIVQGDTARRCENETCGRTFVHQLGGAKHGQHRSVGLRFCTPECARAQAQRQYRRRKTAEKKRRP